MPKKKSTTTVRWWTEKVIVPILGAGGLAGAFVVALVSQTSPHGSGKSLMAGTTSSQLVTPTSAPQTLVQSFEFSARGQAPAPRFKDLMLFPFRAADLGSRALRADGAIIVTQSAQYRVYAGAVAVKSPAYMEASNGTHPFIRKRGSRIGGPASDQFRPRPMRVFGYL